MRFVAFLLCLIAVGLAKPAIAQNVNEVIVFGDSNVDSGFYKALPSPGGAPAFNALWAAAVAAGAGKPTSSPGLMNSEVLAAYFGLAALPANQPFGTNYATSGSRIALDNQAGDELFTADVAATMQFANYLASNLGKANPNALYLIRTGDNDIAFALSQTRTQVDFPHFAFQSPQAFAYLDAQANALVAGIVNLNAVGARYIIVPNYAEEFGPNNAFGNAQKKYREFLGDKVWLGLAAAGVNFIPADFNALRVAIRDDFISGKKSFGFQFIDDADAHTTCQRPVGIGDPYSLLCSSNPLAPSQYANVPNPDQTRLFADAGGHLSTAGQKIVGDYYYSLVVAPSQVSFLAETAVKTRTRLVANINTQIEATKHQDTGPLGVNAWVTGDVSYLQMDNYPGFPDDPGTPSALAAGLAFRSGGLIVGGAVSVGHLKSNFSAGRGTFEQDEFSASVYAGLRSGAFWGTLIGTYGSLDYDINRLVPIGITVQSNSGKTEGTNASLAAQAGFAFKSGALSHGPLAGLTYQRVDVDGFAEVGSFTRLSFGDQTRESAIGTLGWRAMLDLGTFRPFAQVLWNHELASTDRNVTAFLLTTSAPSYFLPAVRFGGDWGTATLGANVALASGVTGVASISTDFGQADVMTYGAQVGINVAF